MPTGRNRCDSGVSTDARAAGTWLRIRNSRTSQLTAPVLIKRAAAPNSAAPRPAKSPAAQALGTRAGRFGHHHEPSEIMGRSSRRVPHYGLAPPAGALHQPKGSSLL